MPELKIKDVRLPALRLPEMSRDDIGKALGDVRRDIADAGRDIADAGRDIDLSKVELPKVDVSRADISKAVESAAQAVGVRSKSRSRVPFVIAGIVTIGLVAWAMFSSPMTPRLRAAAARARERLDEVRRGFDDDTDEAMAFDAAVAVPVQPSAYSDAVTSTDSPFAEPPTDLPDGLGNGSGSMDEVARA
jgi:hypothetical protein